MSIEITPAVIDWVNKNDPGHPRVATDANQETLKNTFGRRLETLIETGILDKPTLEKLLSNEFVKTENPIVEEGDEDLLELSLTKNYGGGIMSTIKTIEPNDVYSGNIRSKKPSEMFSEKRWSAKHTKTGLPVVDPMSGNEVMSMSEKSKAQAGVLLKKLAIRSGAWQGQLTQVEENLLDEMAQDEIWCGKCFGEYHDRFHGDSGVKALIDDATSGGLEIVPIEFDADLISFPLLNGELYPFVDIKPVPRGRRIEGASIDTPTLAWGGGDNTEMSLFSTTSMVDAINTTIHTVNVAIEVGRDFLDDSPAQVGETLTASLGDRLKTELDRCVGNGNGTTQPEGIFQKAGVATVASDNGAGGPPTVDDYESLMFAVGKQYRQPSMRPVFISNDTSYQRSRAIAIDASGAGTDQRPALSPLTEINNYKTLGWDHKIENNLANTAIGFGCLSKYRMYRRLGFSVEWHTQGSYLGRRNLALLIVRGRFGGQVVDANAFAKMSGAQT